MARASAKLDPSKVVVADIGSLSKKEIKRLKEGRGDGWNEVVRAVDDARAAGYLDKDVIVVLVREKREGMAAMMPF